MTEDEMVGWHHQFNGHEFEQTLGDSEGQGSLGCCSPWGHKERVGHNLATEQEEERRVSKLFVLRRHNFKAELFEANPTLW